MAKCYVCEKRQVSGGHITRRGLAKKKGGIGMHVVKNVKRTYKPNIQPARINENGTIKRITICTTCLRSGKVQKAL